MFHMYMFEHNCGAPACIGGWTRSLWSGQYVSQGCYTATSGQILGLDTDQSGGTAVEGLSVGEHLLDISLKPSARFVGPDPVCLSVPDGDDGRYLITSHYSVDPSEIHTFEAGEQEHQFSVNVRVSADDALAGAVAAEQPASPPISTPLTEDEELWMRHRQAEQELRERERRLAPSAMGIGLAASRAATPSVTKNVAVGDMVFIQHTFGDCNRSSIVTGRVRNVGTHVVMVSDATNRNDFTQADYDYFTRILDEDILPVLT
jgi:hypothetical protein